MTDVPEVLETYDYEPLLLGHIEAVRNIIPNWKPAEGDLMLKEKEAAAYREMHLRAEFNALARAFFLSTATGKDLDKYSDFYDVKRLEGAKPTAEYFFELSSVLDYDVSIFKSTVLVDDGGEFTATLLEDVVFQKGESEQTARVELDVYVSSHSVEMSMLQTPLPWLKTVEAREAFAYGADVESDEAFRSRLYISMANKSTAGAKMTYESYSYSADARIVDVNVFNALESVENYVEMFTMKSAEDALSAILAFMADFCTVKAIIYAPSDINGDSLINVQEALNSEEVRPLTDFVKVNRAKEITYDVEATLYIFPNQNQNQIYLDAIEALNKGLKSLEKIGVDISESEVNDFLRVDGVKKVLVRNNLNIVVDRESIAILKNIEVNAEVYYEQL